MQNYKIIMNYETQTMNIVIHLSLFNSICLMFLNRKSQINIKAPLGMQIICSFIKNFVPLHLTFTISCLGNPDAGKYTVIELKHY